MDSFLKKVKVLFQGGAKEKSRDGRDEDRERPPKRFPFLPANKNTRGFGKWILEDQFTHETTTLEGDGEWAIGRGYEPDETRDYANLRISTSLIPLKLEKEVKIPITKDYSRHKDFLEKSGTLLMVSKEHGYLGVDSNGLYFVDMSINGTHVRRGERARRLNQGEKFYLKSNDRILLGGGYPIVIYDKNPWIRLKSFFSEFLSW